MSPAPRLSRRLLASFAVASVAVVASACAGDSPESSDFVVGAGFAPVAEVVNAVVAGTDVAVVSLVPAGEEAHEYEPTAKQLDQLRGARLLALLSGFQPAVDDAAATLGAPVVDLFAGLPRLETDEGLDPHVWLDPLLMATMARTVATALAELDPSRASTWQANADDFAARMTLLSEEFVSGLAQCESDLVVTGHDAFGYLAAAHGLRNVSIAGISPSEEPSAATLEELAALARDEGVTTIFFEEGLPDDLSATLAAEVGATSAQLDPFEALSSEQIAAGVDYTSVMRSNLAALRTGLRCA